MYQKGKKRILIFGMIMLLFCNATVVFASQQKGYLIPIEQINIDQCDVFTAFLNDNLMNLYGTENEFPLIVNLHEIPTAVTEETALYQGQWGAATIAVFVEKQTQRLQSIALILPKSYILEGYSQQGADYFACIGMLSGFLNGINQNGVYGNQLRDILDFFHFDFYTLQSESVQIGNLEYYYEVGAGSLSFMVTGIPTQTVY